MRTDRRSVGRIWQRAVMPGVLLVMAAAGVAVPAAKQKNPYSVFTADHLESTMKTVGLNFGGANQALTKGDYDTAKPQFIRLREQLATTITFWRDHKRDDAIKLVRTAVTALDELDTVLSAEKVDQAAAAGLVKRVGGACQSCHAVYREQDPATKAYRIKPGVVQ